MCAVSMIADEWNKNRLHDFIPWTNPPYYPPFTPSTTHYTGPPPSRTEFELLKKQLQELKKSLEVAKQEDIDNGEPDCEMEEKIAIFRRLGELFGVDFNEVLKPNAS